MRNNKNTCKNYIKKLSIKKQSFNKYGKKLNNSFYIKILFTIVLVTLLVSFFTQAIKLENINKRNENNLLLSQIQLLPNNFEPIGSKAKGFTNVFYNKSENSYYFVFQGNEIIIYVLDLDTYQVKHGMIRILVKNSNYNEDFYALWRMGPTYRINKTHSLSNTELAKYTELVSHKLLNKKVILNYRDNYYGTINERTYELTIKGKTLIMHIYSKNKNTNGFKNYMGIDTSSVPLNFIDNPKRIVIAYMQAIPLTMVNNQVFYSIYADYLKSYGSKYTFPTKKGIESCRKINNNWKCGIKITYDLLTDNSVIPLDETFYLTVSSDVMETLPYIKNPPSPYKKELYFRIQWDYWLDDWFLITKVLNNLQISRYKVTKYFVDYLAQFGVRNLSVVIHQWMKHGMGRGYPDVHPVNTTKFHNGRYGTIEEFRSLLATMNKYGYLVGLHQNYNVMTEIAEYWPTDQDNIALYSNGSYKTTVTWRGITWYHLASDKSIIYLNKEGKAIKFDYDIRWENTRVNITYMELSFIEDSIYLQTDMDHTNKFSKTRKEVLMHLILRMLYAKALMQGPVMREGGHWKLYTPFFAGYVDAVEAQVGNYKSLDYPGIPDFRLIYIKPLALDHAPFGGRLVKDQAEEWKVGEFPYDEIRTHAILFGLRGFTNLQRSYDWKDLDESAFSLLVTNFLKDYYLYLELQKQYTLAKVKSIKYWDGSRYLNLNQALKLDYNFTKAKVRIVYDNGLRIFVNRDRYSNWTVYIGNVKFIIPPFGWIAVNNKARFLEFSAIPESIGHRIDAVISDKYILIDARGKEIMYKGFKIKHMIVATSDGLIFTCNPNAKDWKKACIILKKPYSNSYFGINVHASLKSKTFQLPFVELKENLTNLIEINYGTLVLNEIKRLNYQKLNK